MNYSNITSAAIENALRRAQNITLPNTPTVDVFYVDSITFCGDEGTGIDGCADNIPGKSFAVVASVAAGANGAELEAHELGHDLGLVHCPTNCAGNPNLMAAPGYGSTTLTAAQAAIILGSPLVQVDGFGDNFIDLRAITIAPEPASFELFVLASRYFWPRSGIASSALPLPADR